MDQSGNLDQHGILAMLESITIGHDVAEHESNLPSLFVKDIEVYRHLIQDQVDLITGGKGSGKSAMYRMITETAVADDLEVIPASNPTGSPEFRALFQGRDSEERLRSIWAVYLASLIGNYVVDKFHGEAWVRSSVDEVREILELMGLRKRPDERRKSLLSRIRAAKSVEGTVSGGAMGLELGVALKFELADGQAPTDKSVVLDYPDFYTVIAKCGEILGYMNRRLWIAFDRLDECFSHHSDVERRALRALLRVVLDCYQALQHKSMIRVKVFLRTDLFSGMSENGAFTNATHLRRSDISWTFNSMADLIAARLLSNEPFKSVYLGDRQRWRDDAWDVLLPAVGERKANDTQKRWTTAEQLCLWTADGSRLYNPRNLITLLNLALLRARENQRRSMELGRANRHARPLVQEGELIAATGELSRRRFEDTVLNEYAAVRAYTDRLRSGPAVYQSTRELFERLGLDHGGDDASAARALSLLRLSGLVSVHQGKVIVPRLYRAALNTRSVSNRANRL